MLNVCGICGLESVFSHAGCTPDAGEHVTVSRRAAHARLAAIAARIFADSPARAVRFTPRSERELYASDDTTCILAAYYGDSAGRSLVVDVDGGTTDAGTGEPWNPDGIASDMIALAIESHASDPTAYVRDAVACVGVGSDGILNDNYVEFVREVPESPELAELATWRPDPDASEHAAELLDAAIAHGSKARRFTAPQGATVETTLATDAWADARAWFTGLSETDRDTVLRRAVDAAEYLESDIRDAAALDAESGPALLSVLESRDELESIALLAERCGDTWLRATLATVDHVAQGLTFPACKLEWHSELSTTWADEPGQWWAEQWAGCHGAGGELAEVLALADAWATIADIATAAIDGRKRPN